MPGSNSAFIPTINAITTSQDLQWMVQPTVITSMSSPYSRSHPYGHHLTNGPGILGHNPLARPGVIRSIGDTRGRRKRDEQVRHLRRRVCCVKDYKVIFCEFYIKDVRSTLPVTLKGIKQEYRKSKIYCFLLPSIITCPFTLRMFCLSSLQKKRRRGGSGVRGTSWPPLNAATADES